MRELNSIEAKVLLTAMQCEDGNGNCWRGTHIQATGWPELQNHMAKKLGIADAVQTLKRRGLIERALQGFRLTEAGKEHAARLKAALPEGGSADTQVAAHQHLAEMTKAPDAWL